MAFQDVEPGLRKLKQKSGWKENTRMMETSDDRWTQKQVCLSNVFHFICVISLRWYRDTNRVRGQVSRGLTDHMSPLLCLKYHRRIQFVSPLQMENLLLVPRAMKGEPCAKLRFGFLLRVCD